MKKLILPLVAVVLAVAGSAFTTIQKNATTGDLVWFLVDENGDVIDPDAGVQRDTAPTQCSLTNAEPCAFALSINEQEVDQNGSMYSIASGVDPSNHSIYNAEADKP